MATLAEIKKKAKEFALRKNYKKAIKLYETVIEKKPNMGKKPKFLNEIGELYQSDNNIEQAVVYFKKAVEYYIKDYFYPQAIALCKKILRIKSEDYEIYKTLGDLYAKTVNIGEAIQNYKNYIKYAKNRKLFKEVYDTYKNLFKLIPTRYEFKYELIDYYLENGEEKSAKREIDDFRKFVADRGDEKELIKLVDKYGKIFPDIKNTKIQAGEEAKELADLLTSAIDKIEEKKKEKKIIVENIINENEEETVVKNIQKEIKEEKGEKKVKGGKEKTEKEKEEGFVIERGEAEFANGGEDKTKQGTKKSFEKEEKKTEIQIPEEAEIIEEKEKEKKVEEKEINTEPEEIKISEEEKAKLIEENKKELEKKIEKGKIEKKTELHPELMEEYSENLSFEEINPSIDNNIKEVIGGYAKERESINTSAWDEYMDLANLSESLGDTDQAYHYYIEAADGYYDEGKYDKSKIAYEHSYKINPDNLKPLKKLADIYIKLGDNNKAANIYEQLAENLDKHNAKDEAEKMREKAGKLSLSKKTKKAKEEKGKIKSQKKKEKEIASEEGYIDLSSIVSEELSKEDKVQGKGRVQGKIDLNSILNEEEVNKEIGVNVGGISEVIDKQVSKDDYLAHYDLGISYKEMGMYDMAINEFKIAMKGEKEQLKSLDMLAICHIEMGKFTTAENIFKKALSLKGKTNEEYAGISYNLAQLYEQMGEFSKALDYYKKAKELGGKFPGIEKRINNIEGSLQSKSKKRFKKNKISYI